MKNNFVIILLLFLLTGFTGNAQVDKPIIGTDSIPMSIDSMNIAVVYRNNELYQNTYTYSLNKNTGKKQLLYGRTLISEPIDWGREIIELQYKDKMLTAVTDKMEKIYYNWDGYRFWREK